MTPNLLTSLTFLADLARFRLAAHFGKAAVPPQPPVMKDDDAPFTRFVQQKRLTVDEFTVLMIALAPHLQPDFFDNLVAEFLPQGGDLPAIGGIKGTNSRSFLPTGETATFLLAGNDLSRRFAVQRLFAHDHFFGHEKILALEDMKSGELPLSGRIILDSDYVDLFTLGYAPIPRIGTNFPAQHITTEMEWDDLVLDAATLHEIKELESWVEHNETLLYGWGMHRKIRPGYRVLFYGPPGTGKTLTASLLGKYTGKDVFKIDLSMVVSKFIGETEKNLATLFDKAQNKNWILFFDEADSIFGKRTSVRDAHDKYANQEVSYLLQRIETYPGLAILASNFKNNIDEAFVRRFNSMVYFSPPKAEERLRLWQKSFPSNIHFAPDVNFEEVARKYELTGAHIMNIVQVVCLQAIQKGSHTVAASDLLMGIRRELAKEGKSV